MYCSKCGQSIPDGSVFCNSCGTKQAQPVQNNATPRPKPQTAYCVRCGEVIPNGSSSCNYCGASQPKSQPQPQYRQVPTPQAVSQSTDEMPQSYYTDSWILLVICLIVGFIRMFAGSNSGNSHQIYKGVITCAAAFVFIPGIKVMKNPTGTLLIKILVAIGIIIFI